MPVPFNRRSSSASGNSPTSRAPSRAQNRRGCFSCPSQLCQAVIHSQERKGDALASMKSARHSGPNEDKAWGPLSSSTTSLLISIPHPTSTAERRKVAPDVFAIRFRFAVGAGRRQPIISSGQIDEAHLTKRSLRKVIRRVAHSLRNSHDHILLKDGAREVIIQRADAEALVAAQHAILVVWHDVIAKDESDARRAVRDDDRAALKDRVVIDRDVDR